MKDDLLSFSVPLTDSVSLEDDKNLFSFDEEALAALEDNDNLEGLHFLPDDPADENLDVIDVIMDGSPSFNLLQSYKDLQPVLTTNPSFFALHIPTKSKFPDVVEKLPILDQTWEHEKEPAPSRHSRAQLQTFLLSSRFWHFDMTIEEEGFHYEHYQARKPSKNRHKVFISSFFIFVLSFFLVYASPFHNNLIYFIILFIIILLYPCYQGINLLIRKTELKLCSSLLDDITRYELTHLKNLQEIKHSLSYIQELQLVSQGYRSSKHCDHMPPISRIEIKATEKRCLELREVLISGLNDRIQKLASLAIFYDPITCKELENSLLFKEYPSIQEKLREWHAERSGGDLTESVPEDVSISNIRNKRFLFLHYLSQWMIQFAFLVGASVLPDNNWHELSLLAVYRRAACYRLLSKEITSWTHFTLQMTEKMQELRITGNLGAKRKNALKRDPASYHVHPNSLSIEERRKKLLKRFLLISREMRNHLSTVETSLLLFEEDAALQLEIIDENKLLQRFREIHKQLNRASEKWELGNQQLLNYFALNAVIHIDYPNAFKHNESEEIEFVPPEKEESETKESIFEASVAEQFEGYTGPPSDDEVGEMDSLPEMVPTILHMLLGGNEAEIGGQGGIFDFGSNLPQKKEADLSSHKTPAMDKEVLSTSFSYLQGDLMSELGTVMEKEEGRSFE